MPSPFSFFKNLNNHGEKVVAGSSNVERHATTKRPKGKLRKASIGHGSLNRAPSSRAAEPYHPPVIISRSNAPSGHKVGLHLACFSNVVFHQHTHVSYHLPEFSTPLHCTTRDPSQYTDLFPTAHLKDGDHFRHLTGQTQKQCSIPGKLGTLLCLTKTQWSADIIPEVLCTLNQNILNHFHHLVHGVLFPPCTGNPSQRTAITDKVA